jgi:hypothetical protein
MWQLVPRRKDSLRRYPRLVDPAGFVSVPRLFKKMQLDIARIKRLEAETEQRRSCPNCSGRTDAGTQMSGQLLDAVHFPMRKNKLDTFI